MSSNSYPLLKSSAACERTMFFCWQIPSSELQTPNMCRDDEARVARGDHPPPGLSAPPLLNRGSSDWCRAHQFQGLAQ